VGPVAEQAAPGFGPLLRQLRAYAGLTQQELAEAAGLSPRSVRDLERGIHRTARTGTAGLLAAALELSEPMRAVFLAAARGHAPAAVVLAAMGGAARATSPAGTAAGGVKAGTFLFTDIEGSTALLRRVGEGVYAQVLADHHSIIRSALTAHGGEEVDTQGDGFFAVFRSPRACVTAVIEMQQALEKRAWPAGEHVRVRMGIHTGEAATTATGLVGLDVHHAARVAAVAYGGQVLVSETAAGLVRDWLPPGAALADLGVHRLKDLGRPEQIVQLQAPGLQTEFPPLRSLDNPALPNNLPAQLSRFVGRDRELAEVRALVESCRLVTLTGTGGCGKTRLGLQAAAELLDGSGDGVWLVELAAVIGEDAVALAISRSLGISGQPGRPVLEVLLDALAPQDVLIVLDNCEHVPPLSLPGPGDCDPLAAETSDAVALFVERARAQGTDLSVDEETAPLVVSVCRRLDGLPLAIELAAARLHSLSLVGLHDRLHQRFRLLTGGSRIALQRQQTLRATVEWSYSLLDGAEQLLLRRLSVFAEGFDLDAAEAVCGFGDIEALGVAGLLGSLVDKNLVVAEPAGPALRYRLLETIRQFAAERLAEVGGDEAATVGAAHCTHFLCVAEAAAAHLTGPDQGSWLARLDADQANLRRAAEHAADDPDGTARLLRFGAALGRYWLARSRDCEALGLLVPVLERPEARADPGLFAAALITAGVAAVRCDLTAARRLAEQGVEFAGQHSDDRLLIESLRTLCAVYYFAGEPDRGLPLAQESVERARRLGDDVVLGRSLMGLLLPSDLIEPARSGPLFAEAIACTERSGDQLMNYYLHINASVHALRAGDIPAARTHLEQAAQVRQVVGQSGHHLALNMGWVLRHECDLDGAWSMFEACLRTSRRNGERPGLAYASLGLACLAADQGDWHRAGQLHGAAQAFLDRTGERWQEPEDRYRRDSLDQVRARLSDEQFAHAFAQGAALSLDEALVLASGKALPAWSSGAT
jgi:predicted ATPase/class 3 adenylate cyclase